MLTDNRLSASNMESPTIQPKTLTYLKSRKELKKLNKKLEIFLKALIENGGNITEAALISNPGVKRHSASVIGSRYMIKGKDFIRTLLEAKGLTYGKMLDVAEKKMMVAKDPNWWDRMMKLGGYADFMPLKRKNESPSILNIIQTQEKLIAQYVEGGIVEE